MRKRISMVVGATAAAVLLTTTTASAASYKVSWERACGGIYKDNYSGRVVSTQAMTSHTGDSCDGHAWVRAYITGGGSAPGGWTAWRHDPRSVTIERSDGRISQAQHKGCGGCKVYTTYAR